jgi:small conductance mechanosensitive channel
VPTTLAQDVDVDPVQQLTESVERALALFFAALPGILLAIVIIALFVVIAHVVRTRLEPRLTSLRTPSFGRVFATLAYVAIVVFGLAVALPIAFPAVSVATMLAGLGVLGIAAGFAFQDILSNLLAGILLILRQPFVGGDQIEVDGLRGTVEAITIRDTRLRTYGGRLVFIPNIDVYSNAIEVQTDREVVRSDVACGVAYGSDLARARSLALETLGRVDGVVDDPAPQVLYTEFGASAIEMDLRYWTSSQQAQIRAVQDRVVEAVHDAFEEAGIDIPFDIVTLDADDSFAEAVSHTTE